MRFVLSLIMGLVVFAACTVAVQLIYGAIPFGYWPAIVLLGVAAGGSGYVAGFNGREVFSGLLAGMAATAWLWFGDRSSAWATAIFRAPLTSLNSDEVLLGLSLTLFAFLYGARMGERTGLRQLRHGLLTDGAVRIQDGDPPGGGFTLPAPPEALQRDDEFPQSPD